MGRAFDLLRHRMRLTVNLHQAGLIDGGIGLGRGKRGVAEKFLDGSEITPRCQKVRGKGMAQRVWRGTGRQAELQTGLFHHFLDQARRQLAAAGAEKQRPIALSGKRT